MTLSYEKIETLIDFNEQEGNHYMPNEIFDDLLGNIGKSPHRAFAYSYYYLTSWLYRYAKYGTQDINVKVIKQLLGYSPNNETMNYIIKRNGLMDLMKYTETTKNYPIGWELIEDKADKAPVFSLIEDAEYYIKHDIQEGRGTNYWVKYPVKHMYREEEDYNAGHQTGVFFNISDTHHIRFETFIHCMSIKELGATGFYLYAYLKNKNQLFDGGYDVSMIKLSLDMDIPHRSLARYLDALKKYKLIDVIHNQEYFSKGIDDNDRKANTYITNEAFEFTYQPVPYKKMEVKSIPEHIEILNMKKAEREKKKLETRVEISLDDLPY